MVFRVEYLRDRVVIDTAGTPFKVTVGDLDHTANAAKDGGFAATILYADLMMLPPPPVRVTTAKDGQEVEENIPALADISIYEKSRFDAAVLAPAGRATRSPELIRFLCRRIIMSPTAPLDMRLSALCIFGYRALEAFDTRDSDIPVLRESYFQLAALGGSVRWQSSNAMLMMYFSILLADTTLSNFAMQKLLSFNEWRRLRSPNYMKIMAFLSIQLALQGSKDKALMLLGDGARMFRLAVEGGMKEAAKPETSYYPITELAANIDWLERHNRIADLLRANAPLDVIDETLKKMRLGGVLRRLIEDGYFKNWLYAAANAEYIDYTFVSIIAERVEQIRANENAVLSELRRKDGRLADTLLEAVKTACDDAHNPEKASLPWNAYVSLARARIVSGLVLVREERIDEAYALMSSAAHWSSRIMLRVAYDDKPALAEARTFLRISMASTLLAHHALKPLELYTANKSLARDMPNLLKSCFDKDKESAAEALAVLSLAYRMAVEA